MLCYSGRTNAKGTPKSEYFETSEIKGSLIEFCVNKKNYFNTELLHHHFSVTFTENLILSSTFATLIVSHIFDNTQNVDSKILEHFDSLDDINESQSLWG